MKEMSKMPKKNISEEWAKICAKSNGTMVMVPQELAKEADAHVESIKEVEALAKKFNKLDAEKRVESAKFWHKVRQILEKSGNDEIYSCNVGWNERALKEGVKVINISKSDPR